MNEKRIKNHPKVIVMADETKRQIEKLEKEIGRIDKKTKSESLLKLKEERLCTLIRLLEKMEQEKAEVEAIIEKACHKLTPLEYILVVKLYIEGMRLCNVIAQLQTEPEYVQFCYERSTYARAHRSAMDKLAEAEWQGENRDE